MGRGGVGYEPWRPRPEAKLRVEIAQAVLEEYAAHVPLTVRQIYYRAVGAHGRPKTTQEYDNFLYAVAKARRAGLIDMDAIRDDGVLQREPYVFRDVDDFCNAVAADVDRYRRDRQQGQAKYVEVHCEATGMVDQLAQVTMPYGIPVYSAGGQPGLTVKWQTAKRALKRSVPTLLLHLGDADHHGHLITGNLIEDTAALVEAHNPEVPLAGRRVALTEEQIGAYELPEAPGGKREYQLEALAPDEIAAILRDAIRAELDDTVSNEIRHAEDADRDELRAWLDAR